MIKIRPMPAAGTDIDTDFDKVYIKDGYPNCRQHGAMNKVSEFGYWRCSVTSETRCRAGCIGETESGINKTAKLILIKV